MKSDGLWKKMKFPLCILAAFLLAALWVGAGRILFGVFGWMAFITLFMFAPVIVVYGLILTIIVAIRQRTYRYRKWGPFMVSVVILLAALFCVGFFMPDAGDTKDSYKTALAVILGNGDNLAVNGVSSVLVGWSIFITVVSSIATFVLAFAERPKKSPAVKA